jgi:hypothetical protein
MAKKESWLQRLGDPSFCAIRRDFLLSPAMAAASPQVHKLLSALQAELALHGGENNGEIVCPFSDLEAYGLDRRTLKAFRNEAISLGLLACKRGRAGLKKRGKAHRYRLTYLPTFRRGEWLDPTDEWAALTTTKEAEIAKSRARNRKKFFASGSETPPRLRGSETPPLRSEFPRRLHEETPILSVVQGSETPPLSRSSLTSLPSSTTRVVLVLRAGPGGLSTHQVRVAA